MINHAQTPVRLLLVPVLMLILLNGCSTSTPPDDSGAPIVNEPFEYVEVSNDQEHDMVYQEGCDLLAPYMILVDTEPKDASTLQGQMDIEQGISLIGKALKYSPDNWAAYWAIGKGYQALGESANACDAFSKALELQRDHPDVAREYVSECLELGRTEEAIPVAEHAVSIDTTDAGLVANLALAYLLGSRLDEALETVNKSLEMAPDDEISQRLKQRILDVQSGELPQPRTMRDL